MMKIKVQSKGIGLHPSELVIEVQTQRGVEYLAVAEDSVHDQMIDIGWPVGQDADSYLVELPRETFSGSWRVWVSKGDVFRNEDAQIPA